jgi:hypothetical protein
LIQTMSEGGNGAADAPDPRGGARPELLPGTSLCLEDEADELEWESESDYSYSTDGDGSSEEDEEGDEEGDAAGERTGGREAGPSRREGVSLVFCKG